MINSTQSSTSSDLPRTLLAVLFIGSLILGTFWIMSPFLVPLIWAAMLVIATWPLFLRLQKFLRGSRKLAVLIITLILLLVLIVPLSYAIVTIAGSVQTIAEWVESLETAKVPPPPAWVSGLPLVGARVADTWQQFTNSSADILVSYVSPYIPQLAKWFVSNLGSAGLLIFQFLLTVIIAAILFSHGEAAANGVFGFARRLAGIEGEKLAILAGKAIRGVALGVVVTAIVQSLLSGLGLVVAGLPAAELLTAIIFILCLAQLSPIVILLPAVCWLYWTGQNVMGTALLIWAIPVGFLDNFLRPVLIRKGADLPLLLVVAGVIGGLLSLGVVGIFIGPTVLAVAFTLVQSWIKGGQEGTGT